MGTGPFRIVRARTLVPVAHAPVENAAVVIGGGRIVAAGRWDQLSRDFAGEVVDLGERVLLPGLVNAHCHLDYTAMAGEIPPPRSFTDWIKCIVTLKGDWGYSEYAVSWLEGARMLLRTGTTTVADIETAPELLPDIWGATPLRVLSFLELISLKDKTTAEALVRQHSERLVGLPGGHGRVGLSPHSLYATTPPLLGAAQAVAAREGWRMMTHVAESAEEFAMLTYADGVMHQWLRQSKRPMSDCGHRSPVQQLEKLGLLNEHFIAVHANYLADGDAALLARGRVSVVHCPRSHAYFRHRAFPFSELRSAGVNICLGTDSLASVKTTRGRKVELNMFAEARAFRELQPDVPAEELLRMLTMRGALALGLAGQVGQVTPGALADLIAMPFDGPAGKAAEAVVSCDGAVDAVMIGGVWAMTPG
jgi:cytosine/adenosine deaminase-related metal-dependent hydrolase